MSIFGCRNAGNRESKRSALSTAEVTSKLPPSPRPVSPSKTKTIGIAIGTTFPELATSLLAARRGEADLAIGNIVGSNIFNILLVLGVASAITPIQIPVRGPLSLVIGLGAALFLLVLINLGGLSLKRRDGFLLLVFFAIYLISMVVFE